MTRRDVAKRGPLAHLSWTDAADRTRAMTARAPRRRGPARRAGSRRRAALAAATLTLAILLSGALAVAGPAGPAGADEPAVERVLLISVPGLTWDEVRSHDLPAIEGLLEGSATADMAPRGVSPRATPGAAYLTISAGTRATSDPLVDGQQLALGEQAGGSSAGDIFQRRTGVEPDGSYVALAWPTLRRLNDSEPYSIELGLLADTLAEADLGVEAIGNADGTDTVGTSYERQVGLAAATGDGVVPAGELDTDLLVRDPSRAFGQRLDLDQVDQRFRQAWAAPAGRDGGLVIVEASDLARSMRYRDRVDSERYQELRSQALADTDRLVAGLLENVDPETDAVMLLAPYNLPGDRDLTVTTLDAPDAEAGYLRSASTQRSGFLTLVDVAPTVLDRLDVPRPSAMEGRPAEVLASDDSLDARIDRLVTLNEASRFREQTLFPTTLAVVVVLGLVCAGAMVALARVEAPRTRRAVAFAALADLAVMPMSYLARAFPLEDLGAGFYWAFIVVGSVVTATAVVLVARRTPRERFALVAALVFVVAVPVADVMTGSRLSLSAAFGYSPTGNSRLYGISNYSFGQVAGASCLLATFIVDRYRGRRGQMLAIGLLVALLVVIGVPVFGSDVGGIIAFTPTILVFAVLVTGYRVRWRSVVVGLLVTSAAVAAFGMLDLARPPGQRAHLGRLFERVGDEGLEPLVSIVERKAVANLGVTTSSFWVAVIPIAAVFLAFLARYPNRPLARLREQIPSLRAGLWAAVVAAVLGSAVNDSGAIVGGVTMAVVCLGLSWLAVVTLPPAGRDGAHEVDARAGDLTTGEPPAPTETETADAIETADDGAPVPEPAAGAAGAGRHE